MSDYKRQLLRIVDEYRKEKQPWPASATELARWALANGRYDLRAPAIERICARDLAQAMREEYITDKKGRRVRAKHPATSKKNGETVMVWDDIRTAPREHMQMAFQLRRNHIVSECRQVKTDVDSYNDTHADDQPIQMVLDFTNDVEESQLDSIPEEWYDLEEAGQGNIESLFRSGGKRVVAPLAD